MRCRCLSAVLVPCGGMQRLSAEAELTLTVEGFAVG